MILDDHPTSPWKERARMAVVNSIRLQVAAQMAIEQASATWLGDGSRRSTAGSHWTAAI